MANTKEKLERHTIAVLVDNEFGVLARVIGLFSGRGYNIESLTVAEVVSKRNESLSRITIVTTGSKKIITQIKALLNRLVPVHEVEDLTEKGDALERELALVKLPAKSLAKAQKIAEKYKARLASSDKDSAIFEIADEPERLDSFIELMKPLGLIEVSRTGITAISKGISKIGEQ